MKTAPVPSGPTTLNPEQVVCQPVAICTPNHGMCLVLQFWHSLGQLTKLVWSDLQLLSPDAPVLRLLAAHQVGHTRLPWRSVTEPESFHWTQHDIQERADLLVTRFRRGTRA